jgi:hypothetical protein
LEQVEQEQDQVHQYIHQYVLEPVEQEFDTDAAEVDESKFIWTVDDMTDYNLGIETDLLQKCKEELEPGKFDQKILVNTAVLTLEHQGVIQLLRWIKLAALWDTTEDKEEINLLNVSWFINSIGYNKAYYTPRYNLDIGDDAPADTTWEVVSQDFLCRAFSDVFIEEIISKSRETFLSVEDTQTIIFCQINMHKNMCLFHDKELQISDLTIDMKLNKFRGRYNVAFENLPDNRTRQAYKTEVLEEAWVNSNSGNKFYQGGERKGDGLPYKIFTCTARKIATLFECYVGYW